MVTSSLASQGVWRDSRSRGGQSLSWVRGEFIRLHDGRKGDDNCPAKTLDEMGDHGQGGKKDVSIQDKDSVSWHELQVWFMGGRCGK
jgi:hypothetical protein